MQQSSIRAYYYRAFFLAASLSFLVMGEAFGVPSSAPEIAPAVSTEFKHESKEHGFQKIEIVPNELSVRIYLHSIPLSGGKKEAWSYVSDGLKKYKQDEIVMTLLKTSDKAPTDPLIYFKTVHSLAKEGKLVSPGGYTAFKNPGFIGPQFKGMIYIKAEQLDEIQVPPSALAAILLTPNELEVFDFAGVSRVMALLGKAASYYPCPPWTDPKRASVVSDADLKLMQDDPVAHTPMIKGTRAQAMMTGDELSLMVPQESQKTFVDAFKQIELSQPLRIALDYDSRANAFLVWTPEDGQPVGISPNGSDGSKISGSYLALVPMQKSNSFRGFKDGFSLLLTDASCKKLRDALVAGTACSLELSKDDIGKFNLLWK